MASDDLREGKSLEEIADLFGVGHFDTHLFLCTGPRCCTPEQGQASWDALKEKTRSLFPDPRLARLYRTRVSCFRMCQEGPIAVCYPQGKWFRGVSAQRVGELVEYLLSGSRQPHPLQFREHPLAAR